MKFTIYYSELVLNDQFPIRRTINSIVKKKKKKKAAW